MKCILKFHVLSLVGIVVFGATASFVSGYPVGTTLSLQQAEKLWGKHPFSIDKFRLGTPAERSGMAVDLIVRKVFVGKATREVFHSLGRSDGHFFSDMVPAYLLTEGWKTGADTWQLVFLLDAKGKKVSKVIIQKNCCESK